MNEAGFWAKVRAALHVPPRQVCRKLTDAFTAGTPDAFYVIDGVVGFLELKYVPAWPKRAGTTVKVGLTVEQRRYLEMLRAAGARAHVLLGVARDVFLLAPDQIPADTDRLSRIKLFSPDVPRPQLRELAWVLAGTLEPAA